MACEACEDLGTFFFVFGGLANKILRDINDMRTAMLAAIIVAAYVCAVMSKTELPASADWISTADVMRTARTGDILLFRSKKASRFFLTLNPYTHISTIVRRPDGAAYSVEIHADGDGPMGSEPQGSYAYPLQHRLRSTGLSTDAFLVRRRGPQIDAAVASDVVDAALALDVRYNTAYIRDEALCHFLGISLNDTAAKMHCANFASWVLTRAGIATGAAACIRPIDVVSTLPLVPGHAYAEILAIRPADQN